jgi:hypothetical protein
MKSETAMKHEVFSIKIVDICEGVAILFRLAGQLCASRFALIAARLAAA